MSIEEEIFEKCKIDKNKLVKYGFKKQEKKLIYSKNILNDSFIIIVEYDGFIKGKVIEKEYNDEYINFRLDTLGDFSSNIKNEFINLLSDIKAKCTEKQIFKYEQTKRINKFIYSKYGVNPEFLWAKLPTYCIYRKNKKWFGVIGSIPLNKVNKNSTSTQEVEVLNVKVNESQIDSLLKMNGVYEAFHMNKRNWVSIILDDKLQDQEIEDFICNSYKNVK